MKTIFDNHTKLECMKNINLINVSFIFLRKLASRECVLRGPKMLKIDFSGGWLAVPCPWLYGPGFLDCWVIGPQVKNSKMITVNKISVIQRQQFTNSCFLDYL